MKRRQFIEHSSLLVIGASTLNWIGCTSEKSPEMKKEPIKLEELTIENIQAAFKGGKYTIAELVQSYLDRIEKIDKNGPTVNAILEVNPDAIAIAKSLDAELKAGNSRGPMHGIPVLLKDNIDTHDKMHTTAGSRALQNSKPLQDSPVAAQLRAAGAVILGKANLSEWANFRGQKSSSGWSGLGGQTKNPFKLSHNPCGSSAGSGAAVSANLCVVAIGTETNGSIVCPSHANGIVGIKPTVGLISRSGIIPISFTQDTAGPMARTVRDAAVCLGSLTALDSKDSKTAESVGKSHKDYTSFLKADGLKGKKIAVYKASTGFMDEVDALMEKAIEVLKSNGAEVVEIEKIFEDQAGEDSFQVMLYEYKDGLNKYFASLGPNSPIKNVADLIEFNKKDSIELSIFGQEYLEMSQKTDGVESKEYKTVLDRMLKAMREDGMDKIMDELQLDAIIGQTGTPAWKTDWENGDKYVGGSSSPAAQSGYPNITVPMGFVDGLPVGLSFFGRAWSEPTLLEIAYAYEQATKHRKAPKFLE